MATLGVNLKPKSYTCLKSNLSVALAAWWVNFCLLGLLRSNAVIFSGLVDVFGINRQHAAWPSGMFGFFMSITGAITGFLTNFWSIRTLAMFGTILAAVSVSICSVAYEMKFIIIFYGALHGIGIGLIVPLIHVVLNQNFTKYRAFALGVGYSGSSAGSFVFPPLLNYILSAYDLDGTFLLVGGIMLNALVGTMFFKTPKSYMPEELSKGGKSKESPVINFCSNQDKNVKVDKNVNITVTKCDQKNDDIKKIKKSETDELDKCHMPIERSAKSNRCSNFCNKKIVALAFEVLSSPKFLIISLAYASYFTSSAIFLMVVLDFAKDRGMEEHTSVFLISAFSFGGIAGRLICGWIADLKLVQRGNMVRFYFIVMGALLVLLPAIPNNALSIISIALGVLNGAIIVNYSVLLTEYLGIEKLPMMMGFSTCIVGMSAFLRPVIIGYFRDFHQSYDLLFVFLGLLQIILTAIWFLENVIPYVREIFLVNRIYKVNG